MTYICYPHENFILPRSLMLSLRTDFGWAAFKIIFFVIGAQGSPPQLIFQLSKGWHSKSASFSRVKKGIFVPVFSLIHSESFCGDTF